MSGVPDNIRRFCVKRGTVQRDKDLGLGLQSTGMHSVQSTQAGELDSKSVPYSATASGPPIPPRSLRRLAQGNKFF